MKKLILLLSFAFLLTPNIANADGHLVDDSKKNPVELKLTKEDFNGVEIMREYDYNGTPIYHYIPIPEEYLEQINGAEDPLLEAKKVLTSVYTNLGLEQRLAELNGEYFNRMGYIDLSIPKELKSKFIEQKKLAEEFAKVEKKQWDNLSDEQKRDTYDTTLPIFQDYNDMEQGKYISEEDLEEYNKAMQEDSLEPSKDNSDKDKSQKEINDDGSMAKTAGAIIVIIFIIGIVVFVMLKRR